MKLKKSELLSKYFPNKVIDLTKEQLIDRLSKIIKELEQDNEQNDTKVALLSDTLLEYLEMSSLDLYLQICGVVEDKIFPEDYPILDHPIDDSFPAQLYYDDTLRILLVDTPCQLGSYRTYGDKRQQHLIACLVELAIKNYEEENDRSFFGEIVAPVSLYLVRRVNKDMTSSSIPDIDNVGARNIINVLARDLGISDSFSSLNWNCNTVEYVTNSDEELGTSILIVPEESKLSFETKFLENNHSLEWLRLK